MYPYTQVLSHSLLDGRRRLRGWFLRHSCSAVQHQSLSHKWFELQATVQHQRKLSRQVTPTQPVAKPSQQPSPLPQHQAAKTILNLHTALGLYGLTDSDLFWELQRDTRCMVGWNASKIVVAFRGTASMTNALSDIQVRPQLPCALARSAYCMACLQVPPSESPSI